MKKTILILFILIPALITASVFILPDKEISELENRGLMTRSAVSKDIKDGEFQDNIESFLSDQFPFREELAFAQAKLKYFIGQKDIGGAYICKNGRLIQKITSADIDEKALDSYARKIGKIAENNSVYVMFVPSAEIELNTLLPQGAPIYDYEALYRSLSEKLGSAKTVNLRKTLNSEDCYYKTDHHWTAQGAYSAYSEFCKAKGEEPKTLESFNLKSVSADFQGTLFSKAPIVKTTDEILLPEVPEVEVTADGKQIGFYDLNALETKDKYNVFQGGNHGIVEITNKNAKTDKTLLILKDSFANSFLPYIAGDYSRIILLDERYIFISLEEYVNILQPDEILVLKEIVNA